MLYEIGSQVDGIEMPNREFDELKNMLNTFSRKLKQMIGVVFEEEIANRDAKIFMLQSQINPHFLNNTLEMMNWQARLVGDLEVSKMIEALGILLDQSMNRGDLKLIPVSEVMRSATAYFYILSMRFGTRLVVEKNIDETLFSEKLPPLVLQPLLENAVKHGVEEEHQGKIWLNMFRDGEDMKIEVINTTREVLQERVDYVNNLLLREDGYAPIKGDENARISLGMRNTHKRIRMLFGAMYGLHMELIDSKKVKVTLTVPLINREQGIGNRD
jgi:two-component system sensor histidine kinase YesM